VARVRLVGGPDNRGQMSQLRSAAGRRAGLQLIASTGITAGLYAGIHGQTGPINVRAVQLCFPYGAVNVGSSC